MKIIRFKELVNTTREVISPNKDFTSYRYLLQKDEMGYTVTKTVIPKNNPVKKWHYKNHLEACYCITGKGLLSNLDTGESYVIKKDDLYVLDKHDCHTFKAIEKTTLICIFNPPLKGQEVHDEEGNYAI